MNPKVIDSPRLAATRQRSAGETPCRSVPTSPRSANASPLTALIVALCLTSSIRAGGKPGPILADHWDAAYLEGGKAGYIHTVTQEYEQDNQKILRTLTELRLNVKRNTDLISLAMDAGTYETPEGKVLAVFMRQHLGKNKMLEIAGVVKGNEIQLSLDGKPLPANPWNEKVIGLYRQQGLFKEKQIKPGDQFKYLSFEPSINIVLESTCSAQEMETVELFNGKQKAKLLRVECRPEKVENVQLPPLTLWLDDHFKPVRSQVEIPGLGLVTLYRTTETTAKAPGPIALLPDVSFNHLVRLNRSVPDDAHVVVYRLTLKGDDDPGTAFAQDARQRVQGVRQRTVELIVQGADTVQKEPRIGPEFSQSSYFIHSDHPLVRSHAEKAIGAEQDPWKKALKVEKWVHAHMKVRNTEAMATADHVARTLEGDCSEFAMLTAAMCRSAGVPSRTAVGMVAAEVKGMPVLAFHMWTEVWIGGEWKGLDATLGKGRIGAGHVKIADHSWHDIRTLTPLFPVMRVVGRVQAEILTVEGSPGR